MEGSGGAQRDVSVSKGVERRKTKKWATLDLLRARALSNELWQRLLGGTESRNQNLGLLVGILPVPEDDHILKEQIGPRLLTWGHGWECPAYNA